MPLERTTHRRYTNLAADSISPSPLYHTGTSGEALSPAYMISLPAESARTIFFTLWHYSSCSLVRRINLFKV